MVVNPPGQGAPTTSVHAPEPAASQQAPAQGVGVQVAELGKKVLEPTQFAAKVREQARPPVQQEPTAQTLGEQDEPKPAKVVPTGQAIEESVQPEVMVLQQAATLVLQIVAGRHVAPLSHALVPVQDRWSVTAHGPNMEQHAPRGQSGPMQDVPKPCQIPTPVAPHALEPVGMVTEQARVVELQQAPTQGLGVQDVPPPMKRASASTVAQLAGAVRRQAPLLLQHAPAAVKS